MKTMSKESVLLVGRSHTTMALFAAFVTMLLSLLNFSTTLSRHLGKTGEKQCHSQLGSFCHELWRADMTLDAFVSVPLNPNSTMRDDVVGIFHDPSLSSIMVVIEGKVLANTSGDENEVQSDDARVSCLNPYLMGRLSGPAIGMVDTPWLQYRRSETNSVTRVIMEGQYHVPVSGVYFLEIIVLLCNKWDDDEVSQSEDVELLKQQCLECPQYHRLTAQNATIEVLNPTSAPTLHSGVSQGYWTRHRDFEKKEGSELQATSLPLYTRYQPTECRESMIECNIDAISLSRFEPYEFFWNPPESLESNDISEREMPSSLRDSGFKERLTMHVRQHEQEGAAICLFGASHSRTLLQFMGQLTSIPITHVNTRFASHYADLGKFQAMATTKSLNCTIAVVGIGQWDGSWKKRNPTSVPVYERNMYYTLENVRTTYPSAQLFLWNVHYNALGNAMWDRCPAKEWRHPALVDQYNAALRRIVASSSSQVAVMGNHTLGVRYLDTSFIVIPQWDSAPDWSHYDNIVGQTEALYIAAVLFGIVPLVN